MRPTVLALSPHLDDAAFSCGATMAMLAIADHRVVVATIFTRSIPNPIGFALACQLDKGLGPEVDYMALRRNEDSAAMRILGAEPLWLDFAEAPHRGYASASDLFAGMRPDDVVVGALAALLRALIGKIGPVLILAPRGIGDHVDHQAVRTALEGLRLLIPVAFWTDHPYALRVSASSIADSSQFIVMPDAEALERKIAASCSYSSQIGFQFGGPQALQFELAGRAHECFETDGEGARCLSGLLPAMACA